MNFIGTIEFSKKFPHCHPKVFKGFIEWGINDSETEGYGVVDKNNLSHESSRNQLEVYVKLHKLKIDHGKGSFDNLQAHI